uniref:Uncharacterized protein n=1 Tax=Leersia perrieri TaxID=77586 RepID=A0A0D9WGR0_9ORYZ
MVALDIEPLVRLQERARMIMSLALDEALAVSLDGPGLGLQGGRGGAIEVAKGGTELAKIARVEGFIQKREVADIERRQGELVETFEDTLIERHTIDLRILTATAVEEGVRTTAGAFVHELDDRAQELDWRDRVLWDVEAATANSDVELRVREDALVERERALEAARWAIEDREAAVTRAEEDSAVRQRNAAAQDKAIAEHEAAVEGCEAMADLERACQRIAHLEHTLDLGTRIMSASVARLHEAAREVGVVRPYDSLASASLGGLASQVDALVEGIMGVLEEVDEVAKDSSYDLARQVATVILASLRPQLRPDFPADTEESARRRVADAVDSIMVGFDGTPAAFQLAYRDDLSDDGDAKDAPSDPPAAQVSPAYSPAFTTAVVS